MGAYGCQVVTDTTATAASPTWWAIVRPYLLNAIVALASAALGVVGAPLVGGGAPEKKAAPESNLGLLQVGLTISAEELRKLACQAPPAPAKKPVAREGNAFGTAFK